MARRTDHTRDELSDLVLAKAQQIIETKGVAALTARGIAKEIGYSPGTLYNLFANIDEIILHLNSRTLDDLYQILLTEVEENSGRVQIDRTITAYLKFSKSSAQRWNLLFEHRLQEETILPDWYQEQIDLILELFADILQSAITNSGEKEIRHSARVLWCSLYGICSLAGDNKNNGTTSRSVDEMARSLVYNYISGLKKANA